MSVPAYAAMPGPMSSLSKTLRKLASHAPGDVAFDVVDLTTNYAATYNAGVSMPAASTIKIPVMVEVFLQLADQRFDLNTEVTLHNADRDWGWGELCDAPDGTKYAVSTLLDKMIDDSDNTATNMLIRLVGRRNINLEMNRLGLRRTHLSVDIRTDNESVRYGLRSSPADMVSLLSRMARQKLVDEWSSQEMIAILEGQEHNTLIPEPLPDNLEIAHKTGTLHDTLNDVGVVYATDAPYVIAVMTTDLPSLDDGRTFIRGVSKVTYQQMRRYASWREAAGIDVNGIGTSGLPAISPDVALWLGRTQ
jgi:beta-lactamase class A